MYPEIVCKFILTQIGHFRSNQGFKELGPNFFPGPDLDSIVRVSLDEMIIVERLNFTCAFDNTIFTPVKSDFRKKSAIKMRILWSDQICQKFTLKKHFKHKKKFESMPHT